jgi:hypothetical protein
MEKIKLLWKYPVRTHLKGELGHQQIEPYVPLPVTTSIPK